jgi:DNA-directed RNA polymerase II subunit RPB2
VLQHTVQDYPVDSYDDGFQHDPNYSYDPSGYVKQEDKPEFAQGGVNGEEDGHQFKQDDYWTVINAFFEDKGLVRQQLESYNEFVETTIQEVVEDNKRLVLDQYQQYNAGERDQAVSL